MMRVIVEIHPGGDERRARRMAVIDIANISELAPVSSYRVDALLNPSQIDERKVGRSVAKHDRSLGWAALVRRVMETLEPFTTMRTAAAASVTQLRGRQALGGAGTVQGGRRRTVSFIYCNEDKYGRWYYQESVGFREKVPGSSSSFTRDKARAYHFATREEAWAHCRERRRGSQQHWESRKWITIRVDQSERPEQ